MLLLVCSRIGASIRRIDIMQSARLPLQIPRQTVEIGLLEAVSLVPAAGIIRLRPAVAGLRRDKPIPATVPRQNIQIDITAGQNDANPLTNDALAFLNRRIRNCR